MAKLSGVPTFKSKNAIVYDFLKLNILNGNLKPGEKIVVKEISRVLNISDIPIREAIKKLEAEGLVVITPHVGASVTDIDTGELEKIHVIRTELEGLATRLAVAHIPAEDFKRLEQVLNESEEAIESENFEKLSELNKEFHFIIYRNARNERLVKMVSELWSQSRLVPSSLAVSPQRARKSLEEHRLILQALRKGDGAMAGEVVKQQKRIAWKTIYDLIDHSEKENLAS